MRKIVAIAAFIERFGQLEQVSAADKSHPISDLFGARESSCLGVSPVFARSLRRRAAALGERTGVVSYDIICYFYYQ